jgi:hypothetical protein
MTSPRKDTEEAKVKNVPKNLTLNQMQDKTEKKMGNEKYWKYHTIKKNCQAFLKGILTSK